ncbi:MAG: TolC family protein [Phaeodactylibacter sp.]|uniref:TolC family protein n=1 Tax=Phaeodactylibacter sp. TaxID=1940289 RepID=UPI0032EDB357
MKQLFFLFCLSLATTISYAQPDTLRMGLEEVVRMAQTGAPDVQIAQTAVKNGFWRYQSFLADYRPQISFGATLPNLNRSIQTITLPNGSDAFIDRALMSNLANLSLEQDVALTGGSIFAQTGLERIDIFETDNNPGSTSYLSTPFAIGFQQPLFQFNALKWAKKIQPLVYEEAQREYSEDVENVAYNAAVLFFDVLVAQLNLDAARRDKRDADTLLVISRGRFDVGRIAETELLQIELSAMNADASLASSMLDLQTSTEALRNFLGIQEAVYFEPATPGRIPVFDIDADRALSLARQNRSESIGFERQLREAERELARARGTTGPSADINGYFALSQTANMFGDAYVDPLDQERLNIRLNVPIADWGKAKSRREIARSNQELTQLQVQQNRINFEQEILIKVQQFSLLRNQVDLALRAYDVARRQLEITRQRYRIGKIAIADLNISISQEASARAAYVSALRDFWLAYYDLRRLTLYDFENQESLKRSRE